MWKRPILYIAFDGDWVTIRSSRSDAVYTDRPALAVEGDKHIVAVGNAAYDRVATGGDRYRLIEPFAHPRVWISNFLAAEAIISHGLATLPRAYPRLRPCMIVHPRRLAPHAITHFEFVSSCYLALNMHAKQVYVWLGRDLVAQEYGALSFPINEGQVLPYAEEDTLTTTIA